MKIYFLKKVIFYILFAIWIFLAIFSLFYNAGKTISEMNEWAYLSDSEKRLKIFGDLHNFFILIKDNTEEKSNIFILSKDIKTPYLSIYYLYPRTITTTDDKSKFIKTALAQKHLYLAVYKQVIKLENYERVASFSSKTSSDFGYLYKRK